ncbi:MAG: hypothetical protein LBE06_10845 [Azoarcus sp.]|nr:hypothetical protein [Azoarcus sp.]
MRDAACRESVTIRGSYNHERGGQVMGMFNRGDNNVEVKVNVGHAPGSRVVVNPNPPWARRVKIVIAVVAASIAACVYRHEFSAAADKRDAQPPATLGQAGQSGEAIEVYEVVVSRFGFDKDA